MRGLLSSAIVVQCANPVLGVLPVSDRRSFCSPLCSMGGAKRTSNVIKVRFS